MPRVKGKIDEATKVLRADIKSLVDSGLLPNGYAKKTLERLEEKGKRKEGWTVKTVYNVTAGRSLHEEIVDELVALASENKKRQQSAAIKELLK